MGKTMSIRIPDQTARRLAAVSRAEGRSVNQIVIDAVESAIGRRQGDAAFQERLRAMIAEDAEILEALAR